MKVVKAILILVAVLVVMAGAVWQFWLKAQVEFAQVGTAYGAKVVCSCRFVAEREMTSCQGDFTEDVSAFTFTETDNTVTASVLGVISNTAIFEPGLGCTLVAS